MAPGLTGGELLLCMIGFVMRDGGGEDVVQQWVQSILLPSVRDGFMAWEKQCVVSPLVFLLENSCMHSRARIQAFAMAYAKQVKASGGTLGMSGLPLSAHALTHLQPCPPLLWRSAYLPRQLR